MQRKSINRPSYLNSKISYYNSVTRFIQKDVSKPKKKDIFIGRFIFNFCPIFGISYFIVKEKL